MTDDQVLIASIRASAAHVPDLTADPQIVLRIGRARRAKRRLVGCVIALAVASGAGTIAAVALAATSRPAPPIANPPSTLTSTRSSGRLLAPRLPGCGDIPFDVTPPAGNYNETETIATVDRDQPITLVLTIRMTTRIRVDVSQLLFVVGPSSLGTDPFPAMVQVSLFSGQPRNGQHLPATFRVHQPGRYPVLVYAEISACGTSEAPFTTAQPIGYILVK